MVVEHVFMDIRPGTAAEFEIALAEASTVIASAPGFVSFRAHRGIEFEDRFLLLIEWESVAAHMEGFRRSEAFARWRAPITPYLASPPVMEHFTAGGGWA